MLHRFLHALRDAKLIGPKTLTKLLAWKHSGFSIHYGGEQPVPADDEDGRRRLAEQVLVIAEWSELAKSDWRKGLVAGLIRNRSLVTNDWMAERLQMGARNTVSRTIHQAHAHIKADKKARLLATRLERRAKEQ